MREFPYRGVILDFDGTLVDTRNSRLPLLAAVAAEMGCAYQKDHEDRAWGLPFNQMLRMLVPKCAHSELIERYRQRMSVTPPVILPGVFDFLKYLNENGCTTCVFTASDADIVRLDLELLEIDQFVRAIFGSASTLPSKPDPAAAEVVLEWFAHLDVRADSLLYIGDSVDDLTIAREHAIDFVAVLTGSDDRAAFSERGHGRCYATLEQYIQSELT